MEHDNIEDMSVVVIVVGVWLNSRKAGMYIKIIQKACFVYTIYTSITILFTLTHMIAA